MQTMTGGHILFFRKVIIMMEKKKKKINVSRRESGAGHDKKDR